jgi:predicted GH43/DUF377 family glycosyl hydrolase
MIQVRRLPLTLKANPKRRILKHLNFGSEERILPVKEYVAGLSADALKQEYDSVLALFKGRHPQLLDAFSKNSLQVLSEDNATSLSETARILMGAYFTHEYTIESAALFNPSIVPHPIQDQLSEGKTRFILSLRATGEGHISSIAFQEGYISKGGEISLTERPDYGDTGTINADNLTHSGSYSVQFDAASPLGSRVLFPFAQAECNGMEDARFVYFQEDVGTYLSTYTAYNGRAIHPYLIQTDNFLQFTITPLRGIAASDKGMAIFPEKIRGSYFMVGRQGGRHLTLMQSDNLHVWNQFHILQEPKRGWEMLQMGNCGSPIKTDEGWLLLTHAVGPMRRYVLSMTLLDLEDPSRVIGSLETPIMEPQEEEREGYVPNVLYTCGMMAVEGNILIPYAMSDSAIGFAMVSQKEILTALLSSKF